MMITSDGPGNAPAKPSTKLNNARFQVLDGNRVSMEATLAANEPKIASNDYETGLIVDDQGFVIAAYKGGTNYVDFGTDAGLVRGNMVTHNHPSGAAAFSVADIASTGIEGGLGIRATTRTNGTVELRNAGSRQGDWAGLADAYKRYLDSGPGGQRSITAAQRWLARNAKNYGLRFTKER